MTVRLEYWNTALNPDNWTHARVSYGSSNNNAVISVEIRDKLANPRFAKVTISNQGSSITAVGPFTDTFTDFQRIRLIENDDNVVLFHGRIYGIQRETDKMWGNIIILECKDMLQELAEFPTDHLNNKFTYGSGTDPYQYQRYSTLIQGMINSNHRSSAKVGSSAIDFSDGGTTADKRFRTSAVQLSSTAHGGVDLTLGKKTMLSSISSFAVLDPHSSATNEKDFGYDYYLDSSFDRTEDYSGSSSPTLKGDTFNYFKRGSNPITPGTPGTDGINWKGARLMRPVGDFVETGNSIALLDDAQFNTPKDTLYTEVIADLHFTTTSDGEQQADHKRVVLEALDGGLFGSPNSGVFQWQDKAFDVDTLTIAGTADVSELVKITHNHSTATNHGASHGGSSHDHDVGRIQYQSTTTSTGLILMSFDDKDQLLNFDILATYPTTGVTASKLVGKVTSAEYTFTPSLHRLKTKFGITRPYRLSSTPTTNLNSLRSEAAAALSKSTVTQHTGRGRFLRAPYYYIDAYATSIIGSGNTAKPRISHVRTYAANGTASWTAISGATNDLLAYGIKRGITIAKVDSNGNQFTGSTGGWGWVTNLETNSGNWTDVTAPINELASSNSPGNQGTVRNWVGYTGTSKIIRFYVPIRTGQYCYMVMASDNINGYHFLEEVSYSETPGAIGTIVKTHGTNSASYKHEGPFTPSIPTIITQVQEVGQRAGISLKQRVGTLPWSYTKMSGNNETAKFVITGRQTITWTAGLLELGGLYKYKIRAGASGTLSTSVSGQSDSDTLEYILSFDPEQTPDGSNTYAFAVTLRSSYIPDIDVVDIGWMRAGLTANNNANVSFTGSLSGKFPFIADADKVIVPNSIVSALLGKGAQLWSTNIKFEGTDFDDIKWGISTNTNNNGTVSFGDDDTEAVTAGTATGLSVGPHWVYKRVGADANATLVVTPTYSDVTRANTDRILMATIVVAADIDQASPTIFPISGNTPTLSVGSFAARSIVATDIKADTITATELNFTPQANDGDKTAGTVGGWSINSGQIYSGTPDTSGFTSGAGHITINSSGSIHTPAFYVNTDGSAGFSGVVSISGTALTTTNTLNQNTTKANVNLTDVQDLNAQGQAQTGLIAGTTITGGGITISNGGSIKGGKTSYPDASTAGFFLGYSSGYKFRVGKSDRYIDWDGSTFTVYGDVVTKANVGLANVPNYSSATMMGQNHVGTLNSLDINNTSGNRLQFSSGGISAYAGSTLKATFAADGAAFSCYGPGGSQADAALLLINGGHVSYISAGASASDTRYDAADHYFYNFGSAGFLNGLRDINFSYTGDSQITAQDDLYFNLEGSTADDYKFMIDGVTKFKMTNTLLESSVKVQPSLQNSIPLGSSTKKWSTVYSGVLNTGDIHLSNLDTVDGNEVDGTKGTWTIQEGSDNLFIINRQTGKKYKFKLEEV